MTLAQAGPGPGPARPSPGLARPRPGPGPAQQINSKSIFHGISGISKASKRPVSILLAELVCLLFFRGLRNPSGTQIDQKCSKRSKNISTSSNTVNNPRVLSLKTDIQGFHDKTRNTTPPFKGNSLNEMVTAAAKAVDLGVPLEIQMGFAQPAAAWELHRKSCCCGSCMF